ncbi:MAG: hypothetical protein O7D98_06450 [Candidatus Dadabacteria bacterium]|nr:hypothetical protein [Candidatus Dadabacteria bacterium]
MNSISQLNHEGEFERAWADPSNTRFEQPSIDVNGVLAEHFRTSEPLIFTRTMLWDMEVRKAWRPDLYIPSLVQEGSAGTWSGSSVAGGAEALLRSSQQRLWLEPTEYGLVLEQVYLDPSQQKVTFIGAAELSDGDGNVLRAGTRQPLFHVEHSVDGDELRPLNKWRIVHLTDRPEHRLVEQFTRMANDVWLPEFIEIYIRSDLNIKLSSHDIS